MDLDSREDQFYMQIDDTIRSGKTMVLYSEHCRVFLADASNPFAIAHLMHATGKSLADIATVCVNSLEMAEAVTTNIREEERSLLDRSRKEAIEIVLPASAAMPEILGDGLSYIKLRVFEDGVMNEIITHVGRPIAMYSDTKGGNGYANCQYKMVDNVELCRNLQIGDAMTIYFDMHGNPVVIDSSGKSENDITGIVGKHEIAEERNIPKLLERKGVPHYRPKTPMLLADIQQISIEKDMASRLGFVTFGKDDSEQNASIVKNLSPTGDTVEAAARLYSSLKAIDRIGLQLVVIKRLPEDGFGPEINERLQTLAFDILRSNEILNMCSGLE